MLDANLDFFAKRKKKQTPVRRDHLALTSPTNKSPGKKGKTGKGKTEKSANEKALQSVVSPKLKSVSPINSGAKNDGDGVASNVHFETIGSSSDNTEEQQILTDLLCDPFYSPGKGK